MREVCIAAGNLWQEILKDTLLSVVPVSWPFYQRSGKDTLSMSFGRDATSLHPSNPVLIVRRRASETPFLTEVNLL
jgi:hypothetical protein